MPTGDDSDNGDLSDDSDEYVPKVPFPTVPRRLLQTRANSRLKRTKTVSAAHTAAQDLLIEVIGRSA